MRRYEHGDMVFWGSAVPHWVIEWQPENGPGAYWLVNGAGETPVATEDDITLYPILHTIKE
jgi:hypothetical protein